ncbi:MAG: protein kinase [bacterium]|nr:protein kinase [bacterium]
MTKKPTPAPATASSDDGQATREGANRMPWPTSAEPELAGTDRLRAGESLTDRYQIRRLLGSGGMADVYEAWDGELEEAIAIKVLHPGIAGQEGMIERFKKEIKLARKVVHPNVCRTYDFGSSEELKFVTMELLAGSTLDELTRGKEPLDLDVKIGMFREILSGLEAAHQLGIIHRDLKPQNVMVTPDGHPVIMDFGIARELHTTEVTTTTSDLIGTPAYMAPERLLGNQADHRTDIYSLGVVLYELATGKRPFSGITVFDMAQNQLSVDPPNPTAIEPNVPGWLEQMILRMLAKSPEDRFQNVGEVLAYLPQSDRIKTVLLVDDDSTMVKIVGVHLNQAGFSVVTARDGAEGIQILLAKEPDLLCLDFKMPQMDGFQVADYLKRQGVKVPIFMLTAIQDPQYKKQAARLGIEQFFTKPLDIEGFVEAVTRRLASL